MRFFCALIWCTAILSSCAHRVSPEEARQAQSFYQAGIGFLSDKQTPEAIASLDNAAKLDPHRADIQLALAMAFHQGQRTQEALQRMENLCKKYPDYSDCWNNLAFLQLESELWQEAEYSAKKALESPTYSNPEKAWMNLGLAQEKLEKNTEALQSLRKAISIQSSYCTARAHLSRVNLKIGDFENALQEAKIALGQCEQSTDLQFWYAYVLFKTGYVQASKNKFKEIMTIFRKSEIVEEARKNLRLLNEEIPLKEPKF